MLSAVPAPAGAVLHCLHVEAEPLPNALLRLLEPFVIHDVLPVRLDSRAEGDGLRLAITFEATTELAERLMMRLAVMPVARRARLVALDGEEVSAAA